MTEPPLPRDYKQYRVGTFWLYVRSATSQVLYYLASKANYTALWRELSASSDIALDGEILIGGTLVDPLWTTLTPGANIAITNAPNSITISATGGGGVSGAENFLTDGAAALISGVDITIAGGTNITTNRVCQHLRYR